MKCLMKYQWVKLPRNHLPQGKGVLGAWARLASRAAFRKGQALYCGYRNEVIPGMWAGGVVGLKSILGVRSRQKALEMLQRLSGLGYVQYTLDEKTKKLTYQITDWAVQCSGEACMQGAVYATDGYGFLCLPRSITERLAKARYIFEDADAWLDLWCHSVYRDRDNAFSFLAPAVQYGRQAVLTLETLGQRWGWEKTKVWRFFRRHGDAFSLYRLPGSFGCLVFNRLYPINGEVSLPTQEKAESLLSQIRSLGSAVPKGGSERGHINALVFNYSYLLVQEKPETAPPEPESRVAVSAPIIRAYISLCRNCKNCGYDCQDRKSTFLAEEIGSIRGPCAPADLTQIGKEYFTYG